MTAYLPPLVPLPEERPPLVVPELPLPVERSYLAPVLTVPPGESPDAAALPGARMPLVKDEVPLARPEQMTAALAVRTLAVNPATLAASVGLAVRAVATQTPAGLQLPVAQAAQRDEPAEPVEQRKVARLVVERPAPWELTAARPSMVWAAQAQSAEQPMATTPAWLRVAVVAARQVELAELGARAALLAQSQQSLNSDVAPVGQRLEQLPPFQCLGDVPVVVAEPPPMAAWGGEAVRSAPMAPE